MTALDDWTGRVCAALDIEAGDQKLVLDLARDVAHGVLRPAAPLTAYLMGVAVGAGADPRDAVEVITELVGVWAAEHEHDKVEPDA